MPGHRNDKRDGIISLPADNRLCLCLREVHGDGIYMKSESLGEMATKRRALAGPSVRYLLVSASQHIRRARSKESYSFDQA